MVEIQRVFEAEGLKSELLLQIHDELVFDVVASEQDRVAALVKDILEHAAPFSVPLSIESGFGVNLYEVK
jgi:DNA polymerase I